MNAVRRLLRDPRLHLGTLQARLIAAFIVVVMVIMALSGLLVNRIILTYIRQDEASQFVQKVRVVADVAVHTDDVNAIRAQIPELQNLLGVSLSLITNPADVGLRPVPWGIVEFFGLDQEVGRPRLSLFGQARHNPHMQALVPAGTILFPVWVLVERNEDLAVAQADLNLVLLEMGLIGLLAAAALAVWLGRSLSRPLRELTAATETMALGQLGQRVPETGSTEFQLLARRFNEMGDRLQESFRAVEAERDRLKDFIGDISHELRTPLTALSTFNQLMLEGAGDDAVTRREFLENSNKQVERLKSLTENLIQLSKLDSGLIAMRFQPADLAETIEESLDRLEPGARAKGVAIIRELPADALMLAHDPSYLQQAVDNLVGNAIKYTPPGGHVEVVLAAEDGAAVFIVRDDGPGIDPADVPNLFRRFYRGREQAHAEGGAGLGLAITAAVVAAHGGTVEVTDPTRAEFTMRLPIIRPGGCTMDS